MSEHRRLNYSNTDDLLLALEHEECNSECKQPCHITKKLREAAHTEIERLRAKVSEYQKCEVDNCFHRWVWDEDVDVWRCFKCGRPSNKEETHYREVMCGCYEQNRLDNPLDMTCECASDGRG